MADEDDLPPEGADGAEVVQDNDAPELNEVEKLAVELGWNPAWEGPEDAKVDAPTFLRKTRDINRTQSKELKDLKRQIDGIGKATSRMTELALENQRKELLAQRKEAFETGDEEAFTQADKALDKLKTAVTVEAPPEVSDFRERNPWFDTNEDARTWAINRAEELKALPPARQLAIVEKEAKEYFPELFKDAQPKRQPALGTPQRTVTGTPREKGYATLPPAARKACDEWVRTQQENGNKWATKEAWSSSFYEQEAANG